MSKQHFDFNQIDPAIEARVDELLAQMTLAEKIGQMNQTHFNTSKEADIEEGIQQMRAMGAGSVLTIYGAEIYNRLQKIAVEETRLGIPLLVGNDVIHGYRTIFPIPLAESCSWDIPLMEETARIASEEASSEGTNWIFAPMVDVGRDPRWGRVAEGSGEDAFLGIEIAKARIRGFQSKNLSTGRRITACPKHFAGYGWAEAGKDYNTTDMSERVLRNVILPPFEATFAEGAGTVMSSFNEIAGMPATINKWLLQEVLRDEWDFKGTVLSDWRSIEELLHHGVAEDLKHCAERAIECGTDMDMMALSYHLHLAELVEEGTVDVALIDQAVRRILRLKFMLGLFENPYVDEDVPAQIILQESYRETALEMTHKSCVLLKNEDALLPIAQDTAKIALIGPLADDHHEILGTWHRIGRDEDCESVYDGFKAVFTDSEINYVKGCSIQGDDAEIETAVSAAQDSDIVVMVLGEAEQQSGEAHSRAFLGLPGRQQELLEAIHATGKPIVLVTMSGRPLVLSWADEHIPAILHAWHGGIRTGQAIAELLAGIVSPTGKLTMSWPRAEGQIPVYYNHKNSGRPPRNEGAWQFDQVHFCMFIDLDDRAQYVFGHGLSYTQFEYGQTETTTPEISKTGTAILHADVTNTGANDVEEIVQLYIHDRVGSISRPIRELKGFQRINIPAGETMRVEFELAAEELAFYGYDMVKKVESGRIDAWIAPSSAEEYRTHATTFNIIK